MVERIKMFAASIMAEDNVVVVIDEVFPVTADYSSEAPPSAQHLMTCCRSIFDLTLNIGEILEHISCASLCLTNSELSVQVAKQNLWCSVGCLNQLTVS